MAYLRCKDPVRGEERDIPIRKPLVTIGRAEGNDVVLADGTLAPIHCNLLRKGNHFTLSVIDRSTTFLFNGQRARSTDLKVGDEFLMGRYALTLMEGEPKSAPAGGAGTPLDDVATLRKLVEFSRDLMAESSQERVFRKLLESVVAITGAEKGFLIAFKDDQRFLAASHNVGKETLDLSRVSDSIVERVVHDRKPIIVSDAMHDSTFASARSVVDLRLSSVMCVPLTYRTELLGVLYLGNDSVRNLFDTHHLAVLEVFASQASMLVHTALLLDELQTSNRNLRDQLRQTSQGGMIGTCPPMKEVFKVLRKVAPTDLSVLVLGETGTGKELVAKELHRLSSRSGKPFISINCGAIPENLLESELFGYKKGAFTGALTDKVGKFEAADGGTIFLDEIGEMPMNLQVKLLRVLQERVIERVGDVKSRPLDIRVVSATNKELAHEIAEGRFREDLFYRLNEVSLQLPPLRDRGEDVHQISQFLLNKYAEQYGSKARGFTAGCLNAMRSYSWPGNVRELENRIKKAVIMTDRQQLTPEDLAIAPKGESAAVQTLAEAEEEFKKEYIRRALDANQWNKAQTARVLDVDPRTIFRYIEKFGE
ncbi:MAG: sigma 54-interacting transcriptional regulator [Myxococcota bacterium]